MHKHQCEACECVWEHDEGARWNDDAHACPKCGVSEKWHYYGPLPAEFTNHHLKALAS